MSRDGIKLGLILFFVVDALAVLALWGGLLAQGVFPEGLFTFQQAGTVPIAHLTAEAVMAALTLASALAWWRGAPWGAPLLLFALGMLCYSALNGLGWALHQSPAMALPMALTLGAAGLALPRLLHQLTGRAGPSARVKPRP